MKKELTFIDVLEELEKTTGTNDKIDILKKHKDDEQFRMFLALAMDERITFGVSKLVPPREGDFTKLEAGKNGTYWLAFVLLCKALSERTLTGGAAQLSIHNLLSQVSDIEKKWYIKCIQKDLASIGIGGSSVNKAFEEKFILDFNCSGAKSESSIDKIVYDADAQWKVNGFRTFWYTDENGKVTETPFSELLLPIGRSGLPIPTFAFLNQYIESLCLANKVFDGEVECDDNLQEIQSLFGFDLSLTEDDFRGKNGKVGKGWEDYKVRRAEVQDIQDRAKFRIFEILDRDEFDAEDVKDVYITRRKYCESIDLSKAEGRICLVEAETVKNKMEAYAVADKYIKSGKEGTVVKSHNGKYGFTKDNSQVKIKLKTDDIDCKIIGYEIAKTSYKTNGDPYPPMVGRINMEYRNDKDEVKQSGVGTGKLLTRAFRLAMAANPDNYIGCMTICTSQEFTKNEGVMSCPRVESIRPRQDKSKV